MSIRNGRLPSYEELFGSLSLQQGDEARSVYSPAAYLADILHLLDDKFLLEGTEEHPGLHRRRPDIQAIPLNAKQTFTEIPYLDIVNEVLARAIGAGDEAAAYATLRTARSPLTLPFHLANEQFKQALKELGVASAQLYRQFTAQPDAARLARERLGLSQEEYDCIITELRDEAAVREAFGLDAGAPLSELLQVERFLKATGLNAQQLRELLFQTVGDVSQGQPSAFFINHQLDGSMSLGAEGMTLDWHGDETAPTPPTAPGDLTPNALVRWLDRVSRFAMLANKLGYSFAELNLALRSCCHNRLDAAALQTLAVVQQLRERHDLALDAVCGLFTPQNSLGIAADDTAARLLDPQHKERQRLLARGLGLSDKAFSATVTTFAARFAAELAAPQEAAWKPHLPTFLYRVAALTKQLDITHEDLFCLLDLLAKDPAIRAYNSFDLLIDAGRRDLDCYRLLADEDAAAMLWLVQLLFALTVWMEAAGFNADELALILGGRDKTPAAQKRRRDQKIAALDTLYQQFKPLMLDAGLFASERFDKRAARVIFATVSEPEAGLVSALHQGLLRYDEARAEVAAHRAVTQLAIITTADFTQLGLEARLLDKLYRNLIVKGYLTTEGLIVEEGLPAQAADFVLATDFTAHAAALFALIGAIYSDEDREEALSAGESAVVDVALYPSDLEPLEELDTVELQELYDNLIYNGYIAEDGTVLRPAFFVVEANAAAFVVNADLGAMAGPVYELLAAPVRRFAAAPLALNASAFEELGLSAAVIETLVENLRFNEYIDADNLLVNKGALLSIGAADFNLALAFYPQRAAILTLIQQQILGFQASFYTLTRESFRPVADAVVAQRVVGHLEQEYLYEGQPDEAARAFFLDPESKPLFALGLNFSPADNALIFDQLAAVLAQQQPYQLAPALLADLSFSADETAELLGALQEAGFLTGDNHLPADQLDFFLNVDNALVFALPAFEDYNQDVFFMLHDVALATAAAMDEIRAALATRAEAQLNTVLTVLQDALGVDGEVATVLCAHVLAGLDRLVETLLPPLLAVVDANDRVTKEPASSSFNLAYRRLEQAALLATKLGLSGLETAIAFRDQDLAAKFPERLVLPQGVERIDALWLSPEGVVYLFKDTRFWTYAAQDYSLLSATARPIAELSVAFKPLVQIDAAFTDAEGTSVIIGRDAAQKSHYFTRGKQSKLWLAKPRAWGQFKDNFADPAAVDAAYQDREGKTYLFAGDQYVRYSTDDFALVDEGYPRAIASGWPHEGWNGLLPARFQSGIDASFQGADERTYLFKDEHYISSAALDEERPIADAWGRLRNTFAEATRVDAAYSDGVEHYLFAGDHVIVYQDSLENDAVAVREGFPRRIEAHFPNLPAEFESGLEAAFRGADGKIHLFKDGKTVAFAPGDQLIQPARIEHSWGHVINPIRDEGKVEAAFVGLDGKTYLFAGERFVRYSGADYTQVDEGYPRLIAGAWGGLLSVDAAFVLDGKTYLFGKDARGEVVYVRYSRRDYSAHDEGYPKAPNDNWWNLPVALVAEGAPFKQIDAVFSGRDHRTYLFSGAQFVAFDHKERWWSEPRALAEHWDSIPFARVDAAFVGKDGRTYVFSGDQYIRYSSSNYSRIDDRYPSPTASYWGNVVNNIAKTGRVDAALVLEGEELVNGVPTARFYTYLFSGNQFFRYKDTQYTEVEDGYPRSIASSLKQEPRFQHLPHGFEGGIDAALADRRNLYLFKDQRWHVVADALYRVYELGVERVESAFLDEGALLIESGGAWRRSTALEGIARTTVPAEPALLREAHASFRQELNAVLRGVDGNSYLFKGANCFNLLLGKSYPLAEEWGRPRNNIDLHNRVDAAFVGRDGKTYLFAGDQFFTYARPPYLDAEIEGLPRTIAEHWGGLSNVALAYVHHEQTFLCEQPDADGMFRYVRYSTPDYTTPDEGFPQVAGFDFWQIPAQYRDEGFTEVRAVLFEGENRLLIGPERYLQHHEATGVWSYPRPLTRVWRSLPLDTLDFPSVRTAFVGADGAAYFFSDERFVRLNVDPITVPTPIRERWGHMDNNFVNKLKGSKIDAAFVFRGQTTYLFSGDQYVRYSGADYRVVDPGYPKEIVGNLRKEPCFQNLPDSFEDLLARRVAERVNPVIDAVVANARSVYLFVGGQCHVVSQSLTASYELAHLGRVKHRLLERNKLDAAFVAPNADGQLQTYLFAGDQYLRYTGDGYDVVDDGYPRPIAPDFAAERGVPALPPAFHHGIDAALRTADGSIYLFKGKEYLKLGETAPGPINTKWGKVRNAFAADAQDTTIDAAFLAPAGGLYVFKGDQFLRYQTPGQPLVDEGYPRAIRDHWGDLPVAFEMGIDGAFVLEGKTYLQRGEQYVRYSAPDFARVDPVAPQRFADRWGPWADFLLTDLHTVARFKALQDQYAGGEQSLADFLNAEADPIDAPFEQLAAIFDWDADEVRWLKRYNGFMGGASRFEAQFQLELILRLYDCFALVSKLGAGPSDVYANLWQPRHGAQAATSAAEQAANAALARYLTLTQDPRAWPTRARELHNELNLRKRDALSAYLLARAPWAANKGDLYERLLIDVEMGGAGTASRVQEAIAATQLYFHRYLVNLEPVPARHDDDDEVREEVRRWWKWMKNYRVWEANRKVFLYPENYIRPELRDTKTPGFKTLEEDLLQGEITAASVLRAYKKYLDEYTEVSRLTIAGGYVYTPVAGEGVDRRLVLFGRTKTDPRRYYYRTAEFLGSERLAVLWSPWLSVNVQIDADLVYPVYAFDRVFVFWARVEPVPESPTTKQIATKEQEGGQTVSAVTPPVYAIKIFYSFYNLNKEWVPAQTLKWGVGQILTDSIVHAGEISDVKLYIETSDELVVEGSPDEHDNIVVHCSYRVQNAEAVRSFSLTPELYCKEAPRGDFDNKGAAVFDAIFDEPAFDEASVVRFNTLEKSTDGPWFSFDHKGGSFLVRPAEPPLKPEVWPNYLESNQEGLPKDWATIDAAIEAADGLTYLFDNARQVYRIYRWDATAKTFGLVAYDTASKGYQPIAEDDPRRERSIRQRWGKKRNRVAEEGKVDATIVLDGKSYLFRGGEYITYAKDLELAEADSPKLLAENKELLPKVQVDAAFNGLDGKTYFFNNRTKRFTERVKTPNGYTLLDPSPVVGKWGRSRAVLTGVSHAFTHGEHTYLVSGASFVRYQGGDYTQAEPGYPQPFLGVETLPALAGVATVTDVDPRQIANAFCSGGFLYVQLTGEATWKRLAITPNSAADKQDFLKHLNEDPLVAVAVKGARIYVFKRETKQGRTWDKLCVYERNGARDGKGEWIKHSHRLARDGQDLLIDHALVGKNGKFYLFAGNAYMESGDWVDLIQGGDIPWKPTGSIADGWRIVANRIAATGVVDAALVDKEYTYLFSGDQYVRYTGGAYDFIDAGYPKALRGNPDGLPEWAEVGATFAAPDGKLYFFDNSDAAPSYVVAGSFQTRLPTRERWGIIHNTITAAGVDTAFVRGNQLYLTGGLEYVRYTLGPNKEIGAFIDEGYPKAIALASRPSRLPSVAGRAGAVSAEAAAAASLVAAVKGALGRTLAALDMTEDSLERRGITKIDASYVRGGAVYLFAGERYFRLPASGAASEPELDALPQPNVIRSNWGNLPVALRRGFDTALTVGDSRLYLFKGNRYARYTGGHGPYEVTEAKYQVVRLTTSTAYALNQKLFAGGVPALLSLATQEIDELPAFSQDVSTATIIKVRAGRADHPPISSHLDFDSANGLYYWEIFFHAPLLIAQALNTGQKFVEAKEWYEYIYDPTERANYWKFLPFLTVDIQAMRASCRTALQELGALDVATATLEEALEAVFARLLPWADVFQQRRTLGEAEERQLHDELEELAAADGPLVAILGQLSGPQPTLSTPDATRRMNRAIANLRERVESLGKLWPRYLLLGGQGAQIRAYLDDPFDPHAIAALRTVAYRKAVVMSYVTNLLDWGDMLFRQYTRESINEARMLYILAYDLLGAKPLNLGERAVSGERTFAGLKHTVGEYDLLVYPTVQPHESVTSSYFYIPENSLFGDYWSRVEDRLYKIRQSLNILGISQPLPLFEPPIDPMALVQAVGSGAGLTGALAGLNIPVPHYRYSFMLRKAQELVQKLSGLGAELLSALEKQDAEELSLLQNRQEAIILELMRKIKAAQVEVAGETIKQLDESLKSAKERSRHYGKLIETGLSPYEIAQMSMMQAGSMASFYSVGLKIASGFAYLGPDVTVGLFSFGAKTGGLHFGEALSNASEAGQSLSEGLSMAGEVIGLLASHMRSQEDWQLQRSTAESDIVQIQHQLAGARLQEQIARHELAVHEREIEHNAAIKTFMQNKFTNAQLYQWMAGRLSGLYFQSYNLAYELAKGAEKALQFERGMPETAASFIQPSYWESQRKGLLAGASLGLDLDRMEKAAIDGDRRGLEIVKQISLLEQDPMALLGLKSKGVAEFALSEALFDGDFPGHYCRQIRTLSVTFVGPEGAPLPLNATLTQLSHKTVLEPDVKAVKFLLDPKDQPPLTLRGDWKASQQIVLSQRGEYEENNGLFELRYDDERYLPFEGTGAVSTWRLELGGKGGLDLATLQDVKLTLKYEAQQGGALFAAAVKGLLKPRSTARYFDVANDFPEAWEEFIGNGHAELLLTFTRDMFPGMSSSKIGGLFARYELLDKGQVSFVLNDDESLTLKDARYLPTSGLSVGSQGSDLSFTLKGNKELLRNIGLVVEYTAKQG